MHKNRGEEKKPQWAWGVGLQCLERKDRGAGREGTDTPFPWVGLSCGGQLLPVSNSVGYTVVRTSSYRSQIETRNRLKISLSFMLRGIRCKFL